MNSALRNILKTPWKNDRTLSVEPQQIRTIRSLFPQQQAQVDWQK